MSDNIENKMKEKLLTEALEKRVHILARNTLKEFFNIFAEEFERYKIRQMAGFHPAIMHFNEAFLFMQFIESMMFAYKHTTHISMTTTREMMQNPWEMLRMMNNPEFRRWVTEFKARTGMDIN